MGFVTVDLTEVSSLTVPAFWTSLKIGFVAVDFTEPTSQKGVKITLLNNYIQWRSIFFLMIEDFGCVRLALTVEFGYRLQLMCNYYVSYFSLYSSENHLPFWQLQILFMWD